MPEILEAPVIEAPPASTTPSPLDTAFDSLEGVDNADGSSFTPEQMDAPSAAPDKPTAPASKATKPDAAKAAEKPTTDPDKPKKPSLGEDLDKIVGAKPKAAAPVEGDKAPGPKQLREAYESTKKERDTHAAELKQLKAERDAYKLTAAEEARKAVDADLKTARERGDEHERRLQLADYKESDDYKTRFAEPLKEAWKEAGADLEGAKIIAEDGTEIPVSVDDVYKLMYMNSAQAHEVAHQKYGHLASLILKHREGILGLEKGRQKAIGEFKAKAGTMAEETKQTRERSVQEFKSSIQKFTTDFPELFGAKEGDDEGNALLEQGDAIVRTALFQDNLPADMPPEKQHQTVLHAQKMVALRAKAFGRLYHENQKLSGELETMRQKLAQFDAADPDPGGGDPDVKAGGAPSLEDAIDSIPGTSLY